MMIKYPIVLALNVIFSNYLKKIKKNKELTISLFFIFHLTEMILLVSSMKSKICSPPSFFSAEVTKILGSSSQDSRRIFLYSATLFSAAAWVFILSDLVKMMEKEIWFSPHHSINSKSIFCGRWRISTKTNR